MARYYKYIGMGVTNSIRYKRTKDIFENSRLYMGHYSEMNDPMEALYMGNNLTKAEIEKVRQGKPNIRMCCLSKSYSDVLLWAHYAEDHKGICIEVEVVDPDCEEININYEKILYRPQKYSSDIINKILSHKLIPWQNEQEIRYLRSLHIGSHTIEFLKVRITKVYVGCLLEQSDFNKYKKRIEKWLEDNHHPVVHIIHMQRRDLTYWNGSENTYLLP